MRNKKRISIVSTLHYIRFAYRFALFVMLLISYIRFRLFSEASIIESVERAPAVIYITWAVFVIEMTIGSILKKSKIAKCLSYPGLGHKNFML